MKIIYLHQYFVTPDMSGGTRSYEMARRLVAAGHEVHMITTDQRSGSHGRGWSETTEEGIKVYWANVPYNNQMSFLKRIGAFLSFALRATKKAVMLDGDIIFATSTPLTIAIPALLVSVWKHRPFVFEVRDLWPDVPIALGVIRNPLMVWLATWLERVTYRRASHIVALAPGMRDDIIAKGIPECKVTVIPNGCDLEMFSTAPENDSPRMSVDWLKEHKLVLYAGTIGLVNGVEYLVRVANHLIKIDPEVRFVVIGDGKEREIVRNLARQEGVLDNNFFMLDSIPKRELVKWLHAADIHMALFTGPRVVWKDAVQNKFFDALATGKPIANNFDGWQTQIALDAEIGLMLDQQDTSRAALQLSEVLQDKVWLAGISVRARELAEGKFNRDGLAKELEKILVAALQE